MYLGKSQIEIWGGKEMEFSKQIQNLSFLVGSGGLNGSLAVAAVSGLFKPENIFIIATLFLAGPAAIVTAALIDGPMKERLFVALVSGLLATMIVMFSAGVGPVFLSFANVNVLRIFGGISIGIIAFMVAGVKVPENAPFLVILLGLIGGFLFR
tara:strand:- start:5311 stop:5772 length:462 start_codon:yes stop_codon:yes gene_type:complete